jgi:hypothetical protein
MYSAVYNEIVCLEKSFIYGLVDLSFFCLPDEMKEFIFKVGMPMKWILLLPMIG